jgi:hypothetical protein
MLRAVVPIDKNTKENRADMFTKPLENALFNEHAGAIMGW